MNLSDEEYELLDRYLDDDLADAEAVGLEARLKADATLSAELAKLREFRSMRAEAFTAMEPSEVESQQLQWYLRGALNQQTRTVPPAYQRMHSWTRGVSRVAAVLAVGIGVGYFARGPGAPSTTSVVQNAPTLQTTPVVSGIDLQADGPPQFLTGDRHVAGYAAGYAGGGSITPVTAAGQPAFEVALSDVAGNVVSRRQFRTFDEAREFYNEIARLQQKQKQLQNGGVRLIGDGF